MKTRLAGMLLCVRCILECGVEYLFVLVIVGADTVYHLSILLSYLARRGVVVVSYLDQRS